MCYNVYGFQCKVERQRRKNRIMEEKKVLYSKRFPKESHLDLDEEFEKLNKEHKSDNEPKEGESLLDFLERNRSTVPNEERIKEKVIFVKAAIDLAETYQIDMDIAEYDTRIVANMYLQSSLYTGTIKKLISALMVMADEFDIFPPKEGEDYTVNLLLTYHTHDIFINGRKITDLDWED